MCHSLLQLERDKRLKRCCRNILDCSASTGLPCPTCRLYQCHCHKLFVPPLNLLSRGLPLPRKVLHCPPISQEQSGYLGATVCQEYSSRDLRKEVSTATATYYSSDSKYKMGGRKEYHKFEIGIGGRGNRRGETRLPCYLPPLI